MCQCSAHLAIKMARLFVNLSETPYHSKCMREKGRRQFRLCGAAWQEDLQINYVEAASSNISAHYSSVCSRAGVWGGRCKQLLEVLAQMQRHITAQIALELVCAGRC